MEDFVIPIRKKIHKRFRGVIEDALFGAKNILILSEFSDESMLNEYNSLVDRINRDNAEYAGEICREDWKDLN
jgi:hypothetical protein